MVGHRPPVALQPQDERLFRSFQSNLLSLISHELRTPLTGILNALGVLEEAGPDSGGSNDSSIPRAELVRMARQNAQRLHRTLVTLLDLAQLESGTFQPRLREVDLARVVRSRVDGLTTLVHDQQLKIEFEEPKAMAHVLADPQKLSRAIDLAFQAAVSRTQQGSKAKVRISLNAVEFSFELAPGKEGFWDAAWTQARAGMESGVASPTSAFAGVLQSEEAFLTRSEEGLGSEFLLVHETMRMHRGSFEQKRQGKNVSLTLGFPRLSSQEGLSAVLSSRAYHVSSELGSVGLVLVKVPPGTSADAFAQQLKDSLFRSSDAAYAIPERGEVALVLDDCKPEDAARMMARIQRTLGLALAFGTAHCPADGMDPSALVGIAQGRI